MSKFKAKLKMGSKKYFSLRQRVKALDGTKVSSGWFNEQGRHYSGYTYPELMAYHHDGGIAGEVPSRKPKVVAFQRLREDKELVKKALKVWSTDVLKSQKANQALLTTIGKDTVGKLKGAFKAGELVPPNTEFTIALKGSDVPLRDTDDLFDRTSYKTSIDNKLRET